MRELLRGWGEPKAFREEVAPYSLGDRSNSIGNSQGVTVSKDQGLKITITKEVSRLAREDCSIQGLGNSIVCRPIPYLGSALQSIERSFLDCGRNLGRLVFLSLRAATEEVGTFAELHTAGPWRPKPNLSADY